MDKTYETRNTGVITKGDMVRAMLEAEGFPRKISFLLGMPRKAVIDFIQADLELIELQQELREGTLDDVESKVLESATSGDGANGRFVLQTIGKDRGYSTRTETTGKDGEPLTEPLSDNELTRRVLFILREKEND